MPDHDGTAERNHPSEIALALLDYRLGEVEKRVETMGHDLVEVGRQVTDIPGLITRKFEEQRTTIAKNRQSRGERSIQIGTLFAAILSVVIAAIALWVKGHGG